MRTYSKTIILCLICILSSCSKKKDDTWNTIAVGLPNKLDPSVAMLNMGYYLLKQTHLPFLQKNSKGTFDSNLLTEWSRSLNSQDFKFCLKIAADFDNNNKYTSLGLFADLKRIATKYDKESRISKKNDCILVSFGQSSFSFLEVLSQYENAPTLPIDDKPFDLGLGAYRVKDFTKDNIVLERKVKVNDGYNKIIFHSYNGKDDTILQRNDIEDFNRVLISHLPSWVIKKYKSYPVSLLQTVVLLLNQKNFNERNSLFNCLDVKKFRDAYFPKRNQYADITTILPLGIVGGEKGLPNQSCPKNLGSMREFVIYNWNVDNQLSLKKYFSEIEKQHGIKVKIKNIKMSEFANLVLKDTHPYDMAVIALDAVSEDYEAFFGPLVNKVRVIDVKAPKSAKLLGEINNLRDDDKRVKIIRALNDQLNRKKVVLPLFQEVRQFYFPDHLTGLKLGRDSLEYLNIAEIKL
jgi:hypothetical protein